MFHCCRKTILSYRMVTYKTVSACSSVLPIGTHCQFDFDACRDKPCQDNMTCIDLPAEEHKLFKRGFNCTGCTDGFEGRDEKCLG